MIHINSSALTVTCLFIYLNCVNCKHDSNPLEQRSEAQLSKRLILTSNWFWTSITHSLIGSSAEWKVQQLTPHLEDPATYIPTLEVLKLAQDAQLIVLNGAEYEQGLKSISLPLSRVVKTAQTFKHKWLSFPTSGKHQRHQHGEGVAHQHRGIDGHTWMDPRLMSTQLNILVERLTKMGIQQDSSSLKELNQDIQKLDLMWEELSSKLREYTLFSNHPSYQYVAQHYQLEITAFELSPTETLTHDQLAALKALIQEKRRPQHKGVILLWESPPSHQVSEHLKAVISGGQGDSINSFVIHTLEQPIKGKAISPLQLYLEDLSALSLKLESGPP